MPRVNRKLFPVALVAVVAVALSFAACTDDAGPTAPAPLAESPAAAPGSASLTTGPPEGAPDTGAGPDGSVQLVPVLQAVEGGQPKVDLCHREGNGGYHIINVAEPSVPAHEAHGDYPPLDFWPDADGDGFGDAAAAAESGCVVPPGYVENQDDCDDGDAAINPDAEEVCDGLDNDCNGEVDEGGVCGPVCIDLGCPCFSCDELAANGPILQCGENFPGFPNLAGMIWTSGYVACSGESCATGGLPTTCAITNPFRSQVVSAAEDEACRAMILASCPNPNLGESLAGASATPFIDQ